MDLGTHQKHGLLESERILMKEWQVEAESLEAGGLTSLTNALIKTSVSFKVER